MRLRSLQFPDIVDLSSRAHSSVHGVLSRTKFFLCSRLSSKLYWRLMGEFTPVAAVTSDLRTVEQCVASGGSVVKLLKQLRTLSPDAVTLQIGSGLGRIEAHLCKVVRQCYGLDVSPSMVRRARELVREPNVEFVCGDGTGLELWPNDSFDLIYSFLVFQHLPRSCFHGYLKEAFAKLKPRGTVAFQIPIDELGSRPEPPARHPYGIRYYKRDNVKELLTEAGFSEVDCFGANGGPDPGSGLADLVFRARKPGMPGVSALPCGWR